MGFRSVRKEIVETAELQRIRALVRRSYTQAEVTELIRTLTIKYRTPTGKGTLREVQAIGLKEVVEQGGLFGPQRVGAGKTLFSLLCALALGAKRPVLLLPASLIEKTKRDLRRLAADWQIPRNIKMISYQSLGLVKCAEELDIWQPDVIIADECHRLKNKKAGVTRRVSRYMDKNPGTKFVALSGTMIAGSIKDFAHILRWCLKGNAPIPRHAGEVDEWADALDNGIPFTKRKRPGPLLTLGDADGEDELQCARRAFQSRLRETPGVVATGTTNDPELADCSLYLEALEYSVNNATETNFHTLRSKWETPDGWAFDQATELWQYAQELALGFHYVWSPRPPTEWLDARRNWSKFVRETLKLSRTLDTEKQVALAVDAGELDTSTLDAWRKEFPKYQGKRVIVWHDDSVIDLCAKWMEKGPGIVWCQYTFFARELSKRTGVPYYGEGGLDAEGNFIEAHDPTKPMIVSLFANKEGQNLQAWNRNLFTTVPNATILEQALGRTHRSGQMADEVTAEFLFGCYEHWKCWQDARETAKMIADVQGHDQKILVCDSTFPEDITGRHADRWQRTVQREVGSLPWDS